MGLVGWLGLRLAWGTAPCSVRPGWPGKRAEGAGTAAGSSTLWAEEAAARRRAGEPGELVVADRAPVSGPRELRGCGLDIAGARVQPRAPGSGPD